MRKRSGAMFAKEEDRKRGRREGGRGERASEKNGMDGQPRMLSFWDTNRGRDRERTRGKGVVHYRDSTSWELSRGDKGHRNYPKLLKKPTDDGGERVVRATSSYRKGRGGGRSARGNRGSGGHLEGERKSPERLHQL